MKPTLAVLPTEKAYPVKMEKPYEKPVSKCSENRRSTKPIMEKRRRARINNSLSELKNLILDALKKDNARHSKLEKADILEMTVKHLQNLQRQQLSPDPQVLAKFRAGFTECASEVNRFMGQMDGADPAVRQRLLHHLAGCLTGMNTPPASPLPPVHVQVGEGGVQLVPTRLPSGDIAFLLPASAVYAPATVPISPASSTSSSAMSVSSASPGPVSVLGSSGILSPAASDRCSPSPVLSGRVQDYHHHLQGPAASHHLQGPVASHHLPSPVASHHLQSPVASHHLPSPVASHHRSHSPVPHRQSPLVSHIPVIMHHKQPEQKTVWRPF